MKEIAKNEDMYFSTYPFELIKSDLTTDEEPVKLGGSLHSSVKDKRFDLHYEMELGIVLSGTLERTYSNYTEVVSEGGVWLHSIWEPHGYQITKTPCETMVIIFRPEILFELKLYQKSNDWFSMFFCKPEHRPHTNEHISDNLIDIGRQLQKTLAYPLPFRLHLIQTYLMQVLVYLEQHWDKTKSTAQATSNRFVRIQPALQLAFGSKDFIPEKAAADSCHLSTPVFRREFYTVMNISFPKFSLRYRLRQASLTLLNSSLSIKEIAFLHGFYDLSHFYKDFQAHFGVTPNQFRQIRH